MTDGFWRNHNGLILITEVIVNRDIPYNETQSD